MARVNVSYTFSQILHLAYAFMCSSISRQLNLIYFYYLIQAIEHERNPLQSEKKTQNNKKTRRFFMKYIRLQKHRTSFDKSAP